MQFEELKNAKVRVRCIFPMLILFWQGSKLSGQGWNYECPKQFQYGLSFNAGIPLVKDNFTQHNFGIGYFLQKSYACKFSQKRNYWLEQYYHANTWLGYSGHQIFWNNEIARSIGGESEGAAWMIGLQTTNSFVTPVYFTLCPFFQTNLAFAQIKIGPILNFTRQNVYFNAGITISATPQIMINGLNDRDDNPRIVRKRREAAIKKRATSI